MELIIQKKPILPQKVLENIFPNQLWQFLFRTTMLEVMIGDGHSKAKEIHKESKTYIQL